MEIISGVERHRRWRLEDKLRIVAEAEAPGAVFALVARRHGVSRGQLWKWRTQVRSGELAAVPSVAEFIPVRIMPAVAGSLLRTSDADGPVNTPGSQNARPPARAAALGANRIALRQVIVVLRG
jgi:transposase